MAQWYEFKAWRDNSNIPSNDDDDYSPIEQPRPGGEVFFIQIRFRKVIRRHHQQHLINDQLGGCQSLVVEEEAGGPLIVKSFYVKRSDIMWRIKAVEILFENLRSMGVHPYPHMIMMMMMEVFQDPVIYPGGGVPHPDSMLSMIQAILDFALSMLSELEPNQDPMEDEPEASKVLPLVFGIANVTLEPAAASTLERFSF